MRAHLAVGLMVALAAGSPTLAQMSADVRFEPGNFGTNVSGTIIGDEYMDYRLAARAGQELFAELTVVDSNGNGTIYFNILLPGSDGVAIYNGSMDGNTASVDLPDNGSYTIRVYQMGNDADSGATTGFRLDLSIQ